MSPMAAHAKGGGHGGGGGHSGGGHSSSHSSHSSRSYSSGSHGSSSSSRRTLQTNSPISYTKAGASSRSRSSRSQRSRRSSSFSTNDYSHSSYRTAAPPPSPPLLFPDEDTARRENGYFCPANLPKVDERVDIAPVTGTRYRTATVISNQPALQSSLYQGGDGKLQATPGFENADCTVLVRYDDDGTTATVSAAEKPTPYWLMAVEPLLYGGILAASSFGSDSSSAWDNDRDEHNELLAELKATSDELKEDARLPAESRQIQGPVSGEYWGASEESDEGDQSVRATLKFSSDGKISGRGKDGVDGAYRITYGRWGVNKSKKKPTVAWVEHYDEGFKVVVSGTYEPRTGKIKASFTSSRNVRGNFELAPKPAGF